MSEDFLEFLILQTTLNIFKVNEEKNSYSLNKLIRSTVILYEFKNKNQITIGYIVKRKMD